MHKRYIIFCDESSSRGEFYSNFYGGALVESTKRQHIEQELQEMKDSLHIGDGEIKWGKISQPYIGKYIAFINLVFDIVERGDMKIRIMFTRNQLVPILDDCKIEDEYFLLYYQFIKHAFGLEYSAPEGGRASAILYLDRVPRSKDKFREFKTDMSSLSTYPQWTRASFSVDYDDITDVDSKNHNIIQAVDVILGSMQSRLNEQHTKPQPPNKRRGNRTLAKARVYDVIKQRIFKIHPHFNVGISTAKDSPQSCYTDSYRHWLFVPSNATIDPKRTKSTRRNSHVRTLTR